MSGPLVVARYRDGRLIKGTSVDVSADKPTCYVRTPDGQKQLVTLADLKALFFVKTLDGNARHDESMAAETGDRRSLGAAIVTVHFEDKEQLVGFTNRFPPRGPFFFITPVDNKSNNLRVLVNQAAVAKLQPLVDEVTS
jgi:hypothetical protein